MIKEQKNPNFIKMKGLSKQLTIDELQNKKQIQEFVANLEKGDLGLSEFIDYGYVVYGQTRTGKTATCHLLSGNALKGQKIKGEDMVELATSKNRKAVIGNTMNSETVIPNFFEIKPFINQHENNNNLKQSMTKSNGKTFVIDTPGYGDTYGALRILANGYFHYRLYSRVKNMKFILCFDANELRNTADKFVNTITEFTSYFKDYLDKKQQIWKCCVFLITKVEQSEHMLQDLYEKLLAIAGAIRTQLKREVIDAVRQFIRFIVKSRRVFCIKRFKKGESCTTGHLLEQIDAAIPKWWSRSMNKYRNEVDMDPIVFSLAKPIIVAATSNDLSQRQFAQLTKYYNIRINEIVKGTIKQSQRDDDDCGLSFVLNELVNDAMGSPDGRTFLTIMQKYIAKYYGQLDHAYKDDRQKMQRELFYQDPTSTSQKQKGAYKKFQMKDKNYIVKKFTALKQIQSLKQQINSLDFFQRNLDWLEKSQTYLYQMIKSLAKVSYKKNNASQIVFKYGYLIHRIVQQAKLFLLLTKLSAGGAQSERRLKQAADDEFIDLMRLLKDFMGLPYVYQEKQIHYQELHLMFIKNFQLEDPKYKKLQVNQCFIDFFCNTDMPPEQDDIEKITKLILKFSSQYLESGQQKPTLATKSTQNLLLRLLTARSNCQSTYHLKIDENEKANQIFLIRRTTQQLGKLLQQLKKYDLARRVFKTVRYVQSVSQLYSLQLQQLKSINLKQRTDSSTERQFQLRLQYSQYLSTHYRQHQAIQLLQQTFQLAQDKSQLEIVKNQLSDLMLKMNDKSATSEYSEKLFNGEYFEQLGEELEEEIGNVVEGGCLNI